MGYVEQEGRLGQQIHPEQRVDLHADLGGELVEGEAEVAAPVHPVVPVLPGQSTRGRGAVGRAGVHQRTAFGQVDEEVAVEEVELVGADHGGRMDDGTRVVVVVISHSDY